MVIINRDKEKGGKPFTFTRLRLVLTEYSRNTTLQAIFVFAVLIAFATFHRLSTSLGNQITVTQPSELNSVGASKSNTNLKRGATLKTPSKRTTSVLKKGSSPEQVRLQLEAAGLVPIYDPVTTTDPWKAELFQRLDRIRVACGKLCQLNSLEALKEHATLVPVPGATFSMLQVEPVDCPALLKLEEIDASDHTAPAIPIELRPYFTVNNAYDIDTKEYLRKDIYLGKVAFTNVWKESNVNTMAGQVAEGTLRGTYSVETTNRVRDALGKLPIRDASVLVIGSELPWLEAVILYHGAAKVTTLEYGSIVSEHPKLETLTPSQFRERYMKGTLAQFDGVLSYSSLEHSGLGRYGDALNPWGDILAIARAWCVTKDGGFLFLGLPTAQDVIYSNWHRVYGAIRWPLVTANWKPLPSHVTMKDLEKKMLEDINDGGESFLFTKHSVRSSG